MPATPPAGATAAVPAAPPKPRPLEAPISPRELHNRVSPAVVALVVSAAAGAKTEAAVVPGVLVTASGLIVTSRTAIRDAVDGEAPLSMVRGGPGGRLGSRALAEAVPARLIAVAEDLDLAVVEAMPAESVFYPHLPIARRSTEPGAGVWTIGHGRKRGLWSGAVLSLDAAVGKTGASRWQRAVGGRAAPGDDPLVAPGSVLVDGVGRIAGVVTAATSGGQSVAVDEEGLLRFLLAANAPALRFAGVPPLRRPTPSDAGAVRTPGIARGDGMAQSQTAAPARGFVAANATDMPTVNRKGNLDRRFPTAPGREPVPADSDEKPAAARAAAGGRGPVSVSFATSGAVRIGLADLERNAVPRSVRVDVGDAPSRGARDAALTIVEFGDYHGADSKDAEAAVRALVQGESAPARLFWKDADRGNGADYHLPARAARAAGEQDEFWSMHDRLMKSTAVVNAERVRRLAREIDLDERAFFASLSSDGLLTAIEGDAQRSGKLPVLCSPAFIVNGRPVDGGSIAAAALRAAVDDELTAQSSKVAPPRPARAIAGGAPINGAAFEPAKMARVIADATARRSARSR
ncbi:MAG: thioredoxin domain-containing protein [Haliangium ochraceum]